MIKIHSEKFRGNHSPTGESRWILKIDGPDFVFFRNIGSIQRMREKKLGERERVCQLLEERKRPIFF